MNILIYCSEDESKINILWRAVQRANGSPVLKLCHKINNLLKVLRDPRMAWDAIIASVASHDDLHALQQLTAMIIGPHLILILPDQGKETINRAICLRPIYFTVFDRDLMGVTQVISHLTEKAELRA